MIEIGKKQFLKVVDEDQSGYFLQSSDHDEVFLPGSIAPKDLQLDTVLEVFVYLDTTDKMLATADLPVAEVGDFACLRVKDVTVHGAFLEWGISKDLLVPGKLQKFEMNVGEVHLVKVLMEEETDRLYATSILGPYIETTEIDLAEKEPVSLIPFFETPLGYKVLINKKYMGMIYNNDIYSKVILGDTYQGVIKKVRTDGLIDASLQADGMKGLRDNRTVLLDKLKECDGHLELWDKSSPEDIKRVLGMSKQAFKKAVGVLYKEKRIKIEKGFIDLLE